MILYGQSSASLEVPPPYQFPGVTVNAFLWPARMKPIQDYCDTMFNIGSDQERGFVYKAAPFFPYATLLFIDYPVMIPSSRAPQNIGDQTPYSDRGVLTQREVFVAVPVVRYGLGPASFVVNTTLEWALPFIVVNSPGSAVCGREMLGMGKIVADIDLDVGKFPESFSGTVDLLGWPSFEPGVMLAKRQFLNVETMPVLPTFRGSAQQESPWTLFQSREAGWAFDEMASVSNFIDKASIGLLPTTMRTVGLKQFRDAVRPDKALYQALVTIRSEYSNISNVKLYNEKDVTITFNPTGSFLDILKVFLDPPDAPFQPIAAMRFNADINFDEMRTIHTFSVDRGPGLKPVPASSDLISRAFRPWRGFFFGGSE